MILVHTADAKQASRHKAKRREQFYAQVNAVRHSAAASRTSKAEHDVPDCDKISRTSTTRWPVFPSTVAATFLHVTIPGTGRVRTGVPTLPHTMTPGPQAKPSNGSGCNHATWGGCLLHDCIHSHWKALLAVPGVIVRGNHTKGRCSSSDDTIMTGVHVDPNPKSHLWVGKYVEDWI